MQIKWYSMRLLSVFPSLFCAYFGPNLKYVLNADVISYYRNPLPNTKSIVFVVILATNIMKEIREILMDILTGKKKRKVINFHREMTKLEQHIVIGAFVEEMRWHRIASLIFFFFYFFFIFWKKKNMLNACKSAFYLPDQELRKRKSTF